MKKRFIKWISNKNWIYSYVLKIISNRIVHGQNPLTPKYLMDRGWILEDGFFVEPNVKDRDKIWIKFERHYFRIWHGKERVFIGLKSQVDWFDIYYSIITNY